ncbi:hypothetical protein V6N13_083051 [Hibiscus sabdariffa]|uniref:Uncharacterized protein n=1 Tax=Hibiscus sabdariffa TaxID=183260 RepID=A0ABR2BZ53_9ROSI
MSRNEFYSQVNVPFSWELEPGVSKVTCEDGCTDTSHFALNLPPPPCLSESARFCIYDSQGVLNLPPSTRSSARKGNVSKQDDPFVSAYRKFTDYSNDKSCTNDEIDACSGTVRTRKNTFTLSCKYSCSVSRDNAVCVSHCSKEKGKGRTQGKKMKDGDNVNGDDR